MATSADLIVEDGTGLDDANSYATLEQGDEYHRLRDNQAWLSATENQKVAALINATQYVDTRWTFVGEVVSPSGPTVVGQALEWPRTLGGSNLLDSRGNEIGDDEVPFWIVNGTLEYALASLEIGRLLPDPEVPDPAGRFVSLRRERIGPLEEEVRFSDRRAFRTVRKYALADRILRESGLVSASGSDKAVRA